MENQLSKRKILEYRMVTCIKVMRKIGRKRENITPIDRQYN